MAPKPDALVRLRAWWFRRQALATRTLAKTIPECLHGAGWIPTAGSTGVYLSLRARMPGLSRDAVDRAAMDGVDVVEVPGAHARPPVLVPHDDAALALRLHAASFAKHVAPAFASGRYSEAAMNAVASHVCRALDEGPLPSSEIRTAIAHPDAAELLIGALIQLSLRGIIRRYPADARLDSSKYLYELRHPDDRPDLTAEGDESAVLTTAARQFLRRYGPASVDEIADWAALTKGAVRKALAAVGAHRTPVAGWTDDAWLLPEDVASWSRFEADDDRVVLLPFRDPFVHLRRPVAILARHDTSPVLSPTLKAVRIRDVPWLNHHTVVEGGTLVGVWEFDPASQRIVTRLWNADRALGRRVSKAAAETERFIRDQLGDAKRSAVDPPAHRARRIAFCRKS